MTRQGFNLPIWVGWVCGVVVLKRPWGIPTFPSWLTFSTFYCLFGLLMYCILLADLALNNSDGLSLGEEHRFGKYVKAFALSQYVCLTFLNRLAFLTNAKRLGKLFETLSELELRSHENVRRTRGRGRCKIPIVSILIYTSFAITFITIILRGIEFILKNAAKPSWLKMLGLGDWGYGTLYFLFAVVPLGIVSNVAYAVLMVTALRVAHLFCNFCTDVKNSLEGIILNDGSAISLDANVVGVENNVAIYNILKKKNITAVLGQRKVHPLSDPIIMIKGHILEKHQEKHRNRQHVIDRFEELKELMRLANDSLSTLLLWIVSGMTLGVTTHASQILVIGDRSNGFNLNLITDILVVLLMAIYAMLLELGHKIEKMQSKAKLQLHKKYIILPWSIEKDEMEEVIQEIINWEWKLSANGYFNVDRGLASGIFSLVLNYVVILVQLNIALTETPSLSSCPKNETLSDMNSLSNNYSVVNGF